MAKAKAVSVMEIEKQLKQKKLLPLYYIFGEDSYSMDSALASIIKYMDQFITSDFDKEILYGENQTFAGILSAAQTFPFGSQKKLLILRQAEKVRDRKELAAYIKSPVDFSVIIFIHEGPISGTDAEPYKSLDREGYLFEARELKGSNLVEWLMRHSESKGKKLTYENAQLLTDISGENRNVLESQLEKIFIYLGDKQEITIDSIRGLSTSLKEYTVFDLQNSLGKKNKTAALKVLSNLMKNGIEPVQIIAMLNKYFTGLARLTELTNQKINEYQIARIIGTHPYYLTEYHAARKIYTDKNLTDVFSALLKADLTLKTTSLDDFTLLSIMIAEMIPD